MADRFLFFSDTNQQLFEEALDLAGIPHARTERIGEVVADAEGAGWSEAARELGADCS